MLQITVEQFQAFGAARRRQLEERMRKHLETKHAALTRRCSPPVLERRVAHVVDAGESLGLETVRGYVYLAALMFRFGPKVSDTLAVARPVRRAKSPDQALLGLAGSLDEAGWADVARYAQGRWPDQER